MRKAIVAPVSRQESENTILIVDSHLVFPDQSTLRPRAILTTFDSPPEAPDGLPVVHSVRSLSHLSEGDIVAVLPDGRIDTMFRVGSPDNALFITDQCNSNCLMCSQPPRDIDDLDYHFALNTELVRLIPPATEHLGITGGEPTLLGTRLAILLGAISDRLPDTQVHMLTNGRALAWPGVADSLAKAAGHQLVLGIPLYSDTARDHDFVVQARDAFAQTVLGLHASARAGLRIEVRVVLHQYSIDRLPSLARFIHRNLPFVEHVAIMGLEDVGYARYNYDQLAIEPEDFVERVADAVEYLSMFRIATSLYNFPLCILPETLWSFARKSISDWKRHYLPVCMTCRVKSDCGGVFGTSRRYSKSIRAVPN